MSHFPSLDPQTDRFTCQVPGVIEINLMCQKIIGDDARFCWPVMGLRPSFKDFLTLPDGEEKAAVSGFMHVI